MTEVLDLPTSAIEGLKYEKLSAAYQLIDTKDVIDIMRENGFRVTQTFSLRPRKRDPRVVKHALRMRHESFMDAKNGTIPELVLINSHDGSTSLRMDVGLFRIVCSNGLIVKSNDIYSSRTRHIDVNEEIVINESMKVIQAAKESAFRIEKFMGKILTPVDQLELATRAAEIRGLKVEPAELLQVRRDEDKGDDLWRVFNRVQEAIMKGGVKGVSPNGRRVTTLGIKAMGSTVKTNTKLWSLAEEYL